MRNPQLPLLELPRSFFQAKEMHWLLRQKDRLTAAEVGLPACFQSFAELSLARGVHLPAR